MLIRFTNAGLKKLLNQTFFKEELSCTQKFDHPITLVYDKPQTFIY